MGWFRILCAAFAFFAAMQPGAGAAKTYRIKAVAVCLDCGDATPVNMQTTGKGFATRSECEKGRRVMIAIGRKNNVRITAHCVVN